MRVYVPTTLSELAEIVERGELGPAPLAAYAVTAELRERHDGDDEEELEYAALSAAARESLRLLGAAPDAERRRVVIAADAPAEAVQADDSPAGLVRIGSVLALAQVASVHLDDPAAEPEVGAAALVSAAADAGDAAAQLAVESVEDHELLWFATQELGDLLR